MIAPQNIAPETMILLLKLRERFPPERRDAFSRSINTRLDSLTSANTATYALVGALLGAVIDVLPGSGYISDDWVEIGAAVGAWAGYVKDRKEREQRERIKDAVMEAIREAMA